MVGQNGAAPDRARSSWAIVRLLPARQKRRHRPRRGAGHADDEAIAPLRALACRARALASPRSASAAQLQTRYLRRTFLLRGKQQPDSRRDRARAGPRSTSKPAASTSPTPRKAPRRWPSTTNPATPCPFPGALAAEPARHRQSLRGTDRSRGRQHRHLDPGQHLRRRGRHALLGFAPSGAPLGGRFPIGGVTFKRTCGVEVDPQGHLGRRRRSGKAVRVRLGRRPDGQPRHGRQRDLALLGQDRRAGELLGPQRTRPGPGRQAQLRSRSPADDPERASGIAVNRSNGHVLVDEGEQAEEFDSQGNLLAVFGTPKAGPPHEYGRDPLQLGLRHRDQRNDGQGLRRHVLADQPIRPADHDHDPDGQLRPRHGHDDDQRHHARHRRPDNGGDTIDCRFLNGWPLTTATAKRTRTLENTEPLRRGVGDPLGRRPDPRQRPPDRTDPGPRDLLQGRLRATPTNTPRSARFQHFHAGRTTDRPRRVRSVTSTPMAAGSTPSSTRADANRVPRSNGVTPQGRTNTRSRAPTSRSHTTRSRPARVTRGSASSFLPHAASVAIDGARPRGRRPLPGGRRTPTRSRSPRPRPDLHDLRPTPLGDSCANAHVRQQTGAALLLDCRAYELVSAADTGGYDVESSLVPGQKPLAGLPEATDTAVLYTVHYGAIPGHREIPPNLGSDPYVATRGRRGLDDAVRRAPGPTTPSTRPSARRWPRPTRASTPLPSAARTLLTLLRRRDDGHSAPRARRQLVQGMAGSLIPADPDPAGYVGKRLSADGSHFVFGSTSAVRAGRQHERQTSRSTTATSTPGTTQVVSKTPGRRRR